MELPVLTGSRVVLRPARPSDVDDKVALGVDAGIARMYGAVPPPVMTRRVAQRWYERLTAGKDPYHWVVDHGGRFVGSARLYDVRRGRERRACYGIGLADPAALGRGLGTEATRLVLGHAFGALGLHRVGLRVLAYNARAIACYRKCGFVEEGREREVYLVDGRWEDEVVMSILEDEFRPLGPPAGGAGD